MRGRIELSPGVIGQIMISDALAQTVADLDRYLTDENFDHVYVGDIRDRLARLRTEADDVRSVLDRPPTDRTDDLQGTVSTRRNWIDRMMAEETAHEIATPCFSRSDLLRRGWSKPLIVRLLGNPDWTTQNPHGAGFAPMQCWRQDRVLVAEENCEFKEYLARKTRIADAR